MIGIFLLLLRNVWLHLRFHIHLGDIRYKRLKISLRGQFIRNAELQMRVVEQSRVAFVIQSLEVLREVRVQMTLVMSSLDQQ